MAKSGTISKSNSYCKLEFVWSITDTDRYSMTSEISWTVYLTPFSAGTGSGSYIDVTTTVDGNKYPKVDKKYTWSANQRFAIDSGTTTVTYDNAGNKSFGVYIVAHRTTGSAMSIPTIYEEDGTAVLDNLFPKAIFVSAPSAITDEAADIKVSYTVPKPSSTTVLRLGIDFGDGYVYTNLNKNGSTFTYAITQSDRIAMRDHTSSKSFSIYLVLESTVDGESYEVERYLTCNFVNAEPTFTVEIVDTNTTMTNLTGDATNKFVKGYSNAQVTVTTSTKKGAWIESEVVTCGEQKLSYGSGTFYGVTSSEFIVTVTDSRGYKVTKTITKTLVNYIPLTCNMTVDVPSSSGTTVVRLAGNCFYGSFGRLSNTLQLKYRYRTDGAYSSWYGNTNATINSNNTYSLNFNVTGLDYTKAYTFEACAVDRIGTTYSVEIKVKSTPVFDWGENDFNFNVPVNFKGGYTVPLNTQKQLWNGQYQFNGATTVINLTTPISELPNGIVLVFAYTQDGVVYDTNIQSFFIPKKVVQVRPGAFHTFLLVSGANFGVVGAKSLCITDTQITGHAMNGEDDTDVYNMTYDNTHFVLRDVLGV